MNFNLKNNTIHVNLLKLALALQMDPEMARLMKGRTRERVEAMAARLKPLVQAADDTQGLPERKRVAALAEVRTRQTLKQMQLAVQFQYPVLPEAFTALGRMRLGITPGENLTRLQALLEAVRTMPGFMYPPGVTDAAVERAVAEGSAAQAALVTAKARTNAAAQELRQLRPVVKAMWMELGLSGWIKANVDGHDAQLAFGLSRKKRRKAAAEDMTVVPFSTDGKDPVRAPVSEPAHEPARTVTPPTPVAFPNLGQPKPTALASSNGHSSNGVNGHSTNGVNGHSSNGHSSNGVNGQAAAVTI